MTESRLLIIEDDQSLTDVLAYNLQNAGYKVAIARDGQDGIHQAKHRVPDLIILDLMLPVVDGLEVCRQLRADRETQDVLILMLTAKSEETDQVIGLALGADDYVTKPFNVRILLERVKALLRRKSGISPETTIVSNQGIKIDKQRHLATSGGNLLDLTPSEFSLLEVLLRQPGRAFTRAELIDSALGDALVMERTVDVHIGALRKKLGERGTLVETVRGVGYRLAEQSRFSDD